MISLKEPLKKVKRYSVESVKEDLMTALPLIGVSICLFITFIGLAIFISSHQNVPLSNLTRDVVSVFSGPIYTGMLSNVGILGWSFAAAFCVFGFLIMDERAKMKRYFLLYSGILTSILLFDDLFLFHDGMLLLMGYSEKVWYIFYFISVITLFMLFYKQILNSKYMILLASFSCFAIAIIADVKFFGVRDILINSNIFFHNISVNPNENISKHYDIVYLFEDGFKFGGIMLWMVYFVNTSLRFCKEDK